METRSRSASERPTNERPTSERPTNERPVEGRSRRPTEGPVDGANEKAPAALADLPDQLLKMIAKSVVTGEPGSAALTQLGGVSKRVHGEVRALIARVSLPRTVSTKRLVRRMCMDPVIADAVLVQQRQREEAVAILSRLVDLSKLARNEKVSGNLKAGAIVEKLIDSAHPALLESLRNATVGTAGQDGSMYPNPRALADEVIERLKYPRSQGSAMEADQRNPGAECEAALSEEGEAVGGVEARPKGAYDQIPSAAGELRKVVVKFILNEGGERGDLIKKHGPLCLWDVSAITDFSYACSAEFDEAFNSDLMWSSDLFWDTRSARIMTSMFRKNAGFKGYIGTWDVGKVEDMSSMFAGAGIEDSGIGSWNMASVTSTKLMFSEVPNLSKGLDLSRWNFTESCDMSGMFWDSSLVDGGIGNWAVSQAETQNMLTGANKFTGFRSLKPPKWPENKVNDADVPEEQKSAFGRAAFGVPSVPKTPQARIAGVLAELTRGSISRSAEPQACVIL
jgi:hypothetical protein